MHRLEASSSIPLLLCAALAAACAGQTAEGPASHDPVREVEAASRPEGSRAAGEAGAEPRDAGEERARLPAVTCAEPVPVWREGERIGEICPAVAAEHGYTVVDLSDRWAPAIFSEDPEHARGRQPYRKTYLSLADESYGRLDRSVPRDRYLEVYGIFPTFRVIRERFEDSARHECHDAVDGRALLEVEGTLSYRGRSAGQIQKAAKQAAALRARLEAARERLALGSLDELSGHERWGAELERYRALRPAPEAVVAMQRHLRCEGLLSARVREGSYDWTTGAALRVFQQRHMIVSPGLLDPFTRELLAAGSRDWEHRAAIRALRERVVDATGLVEDGSARREWGEVLGRALDADAFRSEVGHPAAPGGAPDLISPATEAAARALGWTSAEATAGFLGALGASGTRHLRVALRLPPLPDWHSEHMDLRAEIDRGDVYYDYGARGRRVERRPVLTLYARHQGREVALVRWPTTIGGWQPENHPEGGVGQRYKDSPPGSRIWRDVVVSPVWLPPDSTPDDELVRQVDGRYVPNYSLFGPGYRSAYGLVMMMHHEAIEPRREGGATRFRDEGIRTHGSVSYRSILTGHSHGCHRLYNHLAVRLAAFLLRHRRNVRQGTIPVEFERHVVRGGEDIEFRLETRGYLFELTPPVPIEVLEGNVVGRLRSPPRGFRDVRRDEAPVVEGAEPEEPAAAPPAG